MNYHNIKTDDMLNGEGLRVVLWVSSCDHKCKGCFNTQTWDKNSGTIFTNTEVQEILRKLNKSHISGITLSGGDPLNIYNICEINSLINIIRNKLPTKTIWLYTGYVYDELDTQRLEIVNKCDVLIDGKYVDELKDLNLKYRGSSNQRVIDVKKSIEQKCVVLYCD